MQNDSMVISIDSVKRKNKELPVFRDCTIDIKRFLTI